MLKSKKEKISIQYTKMNQFFADDTNIAFMNHGYYPVNAKVSDMFLDTCASMYCFLLDRLEETTKENILDIGCGRGGGTALIKQHYDFKNVFGCDYNEENINFCNAMFENIDFKKEDAEFLNSYQSNFFDCVINIESSHCYDSTKRFYRSVSRILKSDGIFLYADIFDPMIQMEKTLKNLFQIEQKIDITDNVILSCTHMSNKLMEHMNREKSDKYQMLYEIYKSHLNSYRNNSDKFFVYILKKVF